MSNVIHVNESAFDRHILNHKGIVLVDFWAPWCGPCKTLGPILDNVSTKVSHKIVKVNVDEESNLANKYKIRSIPTMIVFKDGKAIDTMVGVISEEALISKLNSY
jgi:thioredoxin 1